MSRRACLRTVGAEGARRGGIGAGDGNRTRTTSLEGWGSTIELHPQDFRQDTSRRGNRGSPSSLVGPVGLEPTTSCSQSTRATKLRHGPCPLKVLVRKAVS